MRWLNQNRFLNLYLSIEVIARRRNINDWLSQTIAQDPGLLVYEPTKLRCAAARTVFFSTYVCTGEDAWYRWVEIAVEAF
jgi:hypothetical protein